MRNRRTFAPDDGAGPGATPSQPAPAQEPSAGAPPAEPGPSSGAEPSQQELKDYFNFDFFAPEEEPKAPAEGATSPAAPSAQAAPGSTPSTSPQSAQPPAEGGSQAPQPAPTPAQLDAREVELGELRRQLSEMQGMITAMRQPAPPVQNAAPQQPVADDLPSYQFPIPPALMQAMASEDVSERTTAVQHLVAGIGRAVHRQIRTEMEGRFRTLPDQFGQIIQSREQAREIFNDFYGTYKDLNDPMFYPLVQAVHQSLGSDGQTWSAKLRDKIATAVYAKLGRQMPGQAPTQTVIPPTQVPPQQLQTTARPPVMTVPVEQAEMLDLLN